MIVNRAKPPAGRVVEQSFHFYGGDVLEAYGNWPTPRTIVSDGAYGVRGFVGDPPEVGGLPDWYAPHLRAWDRFAEPSCALWFWNTEIGWATVHPILERFGWQYVQTVIWDKGIGHIAGNVNGKTIRQYPVVSEICALYRRRLSFGTANGPLDAKSWLRYEWRRSGLPLAKANEACGVGNAATRKYLTGDWLWYWPPGEMVERMAAYAAKFGKPTDRPYFSLDGGRSVDARSWDALRSEWHHVHGLTNVWSGAPLHGDERLRGNGSKSAPRSLAKTAAAAMHLNQKPLEFMRRLVTATTSAGDVVWEPFGGLASAAVAAIELGRHACVAEINGDFQGAALNRLRLEAGKRVPRLRLIG
jgi:site-specific DNA-methyltransferase (adenine-specific)